MDQRFLLFVVLHVSQKLDSVDEATIAIETSMSELFQVKAFRVLENLSKSADDFRANYAGGWKIFVCLVLVTLKVLKEVVAVVELRRAHAAVEQFLARIEALDRVAMTEVVQRFLQAGLADDVA